MCLLVAASAFSLAPGTAVAQDNTPPSVDSVDQRTDEWVIVHFTVPVGTVQIAWFSVIVDGVDQTIHSITRQQDSNGNLDYGSLAIRLNSNVPEGARVIVSYRKPASVQGLHERMHPENVVASFAWDVKNQREIPIEQSVYAVLGRYFEGTGSLSSTERFVSDYLQNLNAKILAEGGLSQLFRIGQPDEPRTAWGTPGTENWGQVGFPWGYPREVCYPVNGKQRCVDTSEAWGWGSQYRCGGENQPGLSGGDHTRFFWACSHLTESGQQTANSQWVPVKKPQPGVDYTRDHQLVRPWRHGLQRGLPLQRRPGQPDAGV